MDDHLTHTPHGEIDRRTLLRGAALLGAAAWASGCGGSEGAAVRVTRGAPQAIALGKWRERARLRSGRVEGAVVAHRDRVHVLGGATAATGASAHHEAYDPARDAWRELAELPRAVRGAGAASGQGRVYVAGGVDGASRAVADAFAYDARADAWASLPPLPVAAAAPALAVVEDLLVAVAGRRVFVLRAGDARWTEGARAPSARSRPAVVALANVVHVIGGREGREPSNRHEVYNPWQDEWFAASPLPTARSSAAAAVLGGQALVAGGSGWRGISRRTEAYDRRTDVWTSLAPLPVGRRGAGAAVVGRSLHVAGGGGHRPGARHDVFTRQ
jgi:N-acetylneuraminic acid mutarotase